MKFEYVRSRYWRCVCDRCGAEYEQRTGRNMDTCEACRRSLNSQGNTHGRKHKGRKNSNWLGANNPIHSMGWKGENHPNWNPNKSEFQAYAYQVRLLSEQTYREHKTTINPQDHPRTLCGVEGGYQLDHKISIKEGFKKGLSPEELAHPDNLQMLPWSENREKW